MKWMKGAKEGIIVAGSNYTQDDLLQVSYPRGIVVDQLGTIYVVDQTHDRIMRWAKGGTERSVLLGGHGSGSDADQLSAPLGLSFDRQGNLYVVDYGNNRVQRFDIE